MDNCVRTRRIETLIPLFLPNADLIDLRQWMRKPFELAIPFVQREEMKRNQIARDQFFKRRNFITQTSTNFKDRQLSQANEIALLMCQCNAFRELQKFQQQDPSSQCVFQFQNEELIPIDVRLPHLDEKK